MRKNKVLAFLLSSLLLLSSCGIITINRGKEETNESTSDTDPDITSPIYESKEYPIVSETDGESLSREKLSALPDMDFEGISVFFAAAAETGDLFNEEAGIYAQSVLLRNQMVNKKYNTKIILLRKSTEELLSDVKAAEKSGDYFADFAVIRSAEVGNYATSGYLRNLKSLPYFDPAAESYHAEAMEQLTIGGSVYGAVGYATDQIESYACLYFNKTLAGSVGIELDYNQVYSGALTWEKLLETIKLSPEGTVPLVSGFDDDETAILSFFSTGQTFLSKENGSFQVSCDTEQTETLIGLLRELLSLKTDSITKEIPAVPDSGDAGETSGNETVTLEGMDIFTDGSSLFCFGTLGMMQELETCGFRWEALPLPKVSEQDEEYSTYVTGDAPVITALSTSNNIDIMGYILQALNTASEGYLKYEFYRDAMKNSITGVNTLDMIDLICENPVYDFSRMFGESSKALRNGTYNAFVSAVEGTRDFSYYLSKHKKALNSYLNSF